MLDFKASQKLHKSQKKKKKSSKFSYISRFKILTKLSNKLKD